MKRLPSILATLALSVSALAVAAPSAAIADEPPGAAYVAVGDSVASGNGNLPYLDEACLRSARSYPMQLAEELGLSLVSEACSGAPTQEVLVQVEDLSASGALGASTELVTLTAGVNNVQWLAGGWGETLIACSNVDLIPVDCGTALFLSLSSLASLPTDIAGLIGAIREEAPTAQIVVTGYPLLFGEFSGTCRVGLLDIPEAGLRTQLSFGAAEAQQINAAIGVANTLIAQGVALAGDPNTLYVDVNAVPEGIEGFDGHGLCDTGDRWISGLFPATAQPKDRGFHPNAAGQQAYARIIADAIAG